jgi:hypothetical protein
MRARIRWSNIKNGRLKEQDASILGPRLHDVVLSLISLRELLRESRRLFDPSRHLMLYGLAVSDAGSDEHSMVCKAGERLSA